MALRVLYTACARKYNQPTLSSAVNAITVSSNGHAIAIKDEKNDWIHDLTTTDEKKPAVLTSVQTTESDYNSDKSESSKDASSQIIAVLPQYTYDHSVSLIIRENSLPQLPGSFSVFKGTELLFNVERERPSLTHRQHIIDARTGSLILTVRTHLGQLPISYQFEDPSGATVLDLQGNFFVPFTGAKSTATLYNSAAGEKVGLAMQGSYRNRHASIQSEMTGETLVSMTSRVLETRNLVGGRRTYQVDVKAGFDVAVAVGMIVALDSRAA